MTSIGWLHQQISYFEVGNDRIVLHSRDLAELVKQALKMEKISDEEIEIAAANLANPNADKTDNWIEGARWYREQLK